MEDKDLFLCPFCGCKKYREKMQEPIILGGRNAVDYYYCSGCTAVFTNPVEFSKKIRMATMKRLRINKIGRKKIKVKNKKKK
jgi:hypothetical protein